MRSLVDQIERNEEAVNISSAKIDDFATNNNTLLTVSDYLGQGLYLGILMKHLIAFIWMTCLETMMFSNKQQH